MATLRLYSARYSPARGNHLVVEREVQAHEAEQWLAIYRRDEPGVSFGVSTKAAATLRRYKDIGHKRDAA